MTIWNMYVGYLICSLFSNAFKLLGRFQQI